MFFNKINLLFFQEKESSNNGSSAWEQDDVSAWEFDDWELDDWELSSWELGVDVESDSIIQLEKNIVFTFNCTVPNYNLLCSKNLPFENFIFNSPSFSFKSTGGNPAWLTISLTFSLR